MSHFQDILCPVDLSDNDPLPIELATNLARTYQAKLVFLFVIRPLIPEEALIGRDLLESATEEDKNRFKKIRPTDPSVVFEHRFVRGIPGHEIVRAASEFDLIVMSTHGHSGIRKLFTGSVSEYVVRHAHCPVLTIKNPFAAANLTREPSGKSKNQFVSDVMQKIDAVRAVENVEKIDTHLEDSHQTAVPVVNELGQCIGILTATDVQKYHELKNRLAAHDVSVIEEVFETNKFGQRRTCDQGFGTVKRHMSSPPITIGPEEPLDVAVHIFKTHPEIHHLIVVDPSNRPLGTIQAANVIDPLATY